jgi:hypothetical protein
MGLDLCESGSHKFALPIAISRSEMADATGALQYGSISISSRLAVVSRHAIQISGKMNLI